METRRRLGKRRWQVRGLLLLIATAAASVTICADQQLAVGSVLLKLGEPEAVVVEELRKQYKVDRFDGGWSIQPLNRNPGGPSISMLTTHGRIQTVSIMWDPGFTPTAEVLAEQLSHALPDRARCEVRNVTIAQEGGKVRTLEWLCGRYRVRLVTGVYPGGNTASISIGLY